MRLPLAAALLLAGCRGSLDDPDTVLDIRAVALGTYLRGHGWNGVSTWCVRDREVPGTEPSPCDRDEDTLVAELQARGYPVVGADACVAEATAHGCLVDAETGVDATRFSVGCPAEEAGGSVTISVGSFDCDLAAEVYECTLSWTAFGGWAIDTCMLVAIA